MPLFSDKDQIYTAIQNNLSGWKLSPGSNGYDLWELPSGETIVVSFTNTNFNTTANRPKPQVRIYADKAYAGLLYAKEKGLRFFFFAYCKNSAQQLKFHSAGDPSIYLLSVESPLAEANPHRLDIRSMYDQLETSYGKEFFRVTASMHNCPTLRQGAFIRLTDHSGKFSADVLEQYLLYFDSRPYMADVAAGARPVFVPSALYQSSTAPLSLPWNLLVHGAPGTGKSHFIDKQINDYKQTGVDVKARRVTFYEDYSYGQFVGQYMPVPDGDLTQQVDISIPNGTISGTITSEHITYRFVPGPFAEMLAMSLAAKLNGDETKFVLIIEELNRANAASVFGDVFQLLDRDKGVSIYEITPQTELAEYLYGAVFGLLKPNAPIPSEDAFAHIRLPDNLYIWATMNSADQGVFPLDSAFKRRWSYIYRDIFEVDPASAFHPSICLPWYENATNSFEAVEFDWDTFRTAINRAILDAGFAEDRCVGYWFLSEQEMDEIKAYTEAAVENRNGTGAHDLTVLPNPLVDKLFAYLLQDVFRNTPASFFADGIHTLSEVRQAIKTLPGTDGLQGVCRLDPGSAYIRRP